MLGIYRLLFVCVSVPVRICNCDISVVGRNILKTVTDTTLDIQGTTYICRTHTLSIGAVRFYLG